MQAGLLTGDFTPQARSLPSSDPTFSSDPIP